MRPYGLIADLHLHSWSAFSTVNDDGVNSRLRILLSEIARCANEVRKAGGDTIIIAGDMFHVRGSVAPSVLNPTMDVLRKLIGLDFRFVVLAGNHDLEGKEANRLGSAITALEGVGCTVVNEILDGLDCVLVPWIQDVGLLKVQIETIVASRSDRDEVDLILHAPIDGVIPGLPDHGLAPDYLGTLGFRSVYAGHYHHHKEFDGSIYSIGALAHHTWSDIGTKAGFLIVGDGGPRWFKSHAPEFVEITAETDPGEIPLLADGNYCRAKINSTKVKDVEELRAYLTSCGAKGVVILAQKEATATAREGGATIKAGASLDVSVADFIKAQGYSNPERLAVLCQDILNETKGAA
ncbi:MAG: metallophosphoesterase [Betaproteobacteria bacterium]|nr:metallophosphoesterase [Betaproteobacteria bacterium]